MNDCSHAPTVLHKDHYGYLVHCNNCGGFQLSFGTFYVNQNREDLETFADLINRYNHRHLTRPDRSNRDIYIPSPYQGLGLVLSPIDLERLNTILQKSLLILAASGRVALQ